MRRLSKLLAVLAVAAGGVVMPGRAGETVAAPPAAPAAAPLAIAVAATPAWVRPSPLPAADKARTDLAQNGVAYLLVDQQYRAGADGYVEWGRVASKVVNRSGLEATGAISISYDPGFEDLGIAFVHVIRDGRVIDLTQATRFRVVEREDELDDGIVSGMLKAVANLPDIRVGDVVDYATTRTVRTRLWPGQTFLHFSQRYSDPLALRQLRILWPTGASPRSKAINSDIAFAVTQTADGTEWQWRATDMPAVQGEDNVPDEAFQWGRVDISTLRDWGELARWAVGLYQGDDSLPADFAARLDAIAAASTSPADRLTAATRFVQDNIRYVGEEMGEGSYVPRRPATVLARAYGDCKDKSLLLAVALRRLGIDAVPALVSTSAGARLPDRLPSPLVFDHVIVRVAIDGKLLWIDPTGSHRGGRGLAMVPSDLGFALPIRAGQTALEAITGYGDRAGRTTALEQFAIDEAAATPLTLHVETRYTDARADRLRASWAASSPRSFADNNLKFYRERFPGIAESRPVEVVDDRDTNVLTIVENYAMSREAFTSAKIAAKLVTRADALQNILPARQANPRSQPLALRDHFVAEQTIELRVKGRILDALADVDATAGAATFARRTERLPDGIRMVYRLDTGPRAIVPAGEAEAVYALSDQVGDSVGTEFYLDKARSVATAPKGIDPATWALIEADVAQIQPLMAKTDEPSRLSALTLLGTAIAKVPRPSPAAGMLHGLQGAILADLRRPQAALLALQAATEQYDGNPPVFRLRIAYELDFGTPETLLKAMARTLRAQPAVLADLDPQWVRVADQKLRGLAPPARVTAGEDICIMLADAGWQQAPRTAFGNEILTCAIVAHSRRGDIAAARAGLAKAPPTRALLTLALSRSHQALWPDVDRLGGDRFRASLERDLTRAAAAAAAAPRDHVAVMAHMRALAALGRFPEALAVGKPLASDMAAVEVAGRDAFWLVNEYAAILRALGRDDEAIAAMDAVLALGIDRYPDLVSLAVNRAEWVLAAGHYQAALDSLADIEAHHLDKLNPYGKMWIWADRACALGALGRGDEAKAMLARLAVKRDDNWNAVTSAAACRGDDAALAEIIIARLRDSVSRDAALRLFVDFAQHGALTPYEKAKYGAVTRVAARPEVRAELAKVGRAIGFAGTSHGLGDF